eukprot:3316640-Karenia_brevis.AAC.1
MQSRPDGGSFSPLFFKHDRRTPGAQLDEPDVEPISSASGSQQLSGSRAFKQMGSIWSSGSEH